MPLNPTPWAVGQAGAKVKVPVGRNLAHKATQGASGIGSPGDFRPSSTPTPGGSVRLQAGSFVIKSRFPGTFDESYTDWAGTFTDVPIDPTTIAARYDLVTLRIFDPEFTADGGPVPVGGAETYEYARFHVYKGVSAAVATNKRSARAYLAGLGHTAIPVCGVSMPLQTATVAGSYITDLRSMANPRRERNVLYKNLGSTDGETLTATAAAGEYWPNAAAASFQVEIPDWATRVKVRAEWSQVLHRPPSASGEHWLAIGAPGGADTFSTQRSRWDTPVTNDPFRNSWSVFDDIAVPASARGQLRQVIMWARLFTGSQAGARPQMDLSSGVGIDLEFVETPTQDV